MLLRCELGGRQVQGGPTTHNLLYMKTGWGGSELWHVSQAVKPGTLGLSFCLHPSSLGVHKPQETGFSLRPAAV